MRTNKRPTVQTKVNEHNSFNTHSHIRLFAEPAIIVQFFVVILYLFFPRFLNSQSFHFCFHFTLLFAFRNCSVEFSFLFFRSFSFALACLSSLLFILFILPLFTIHLILEVCDAFEVVVSLRSTAIINVFSAVTFSLCVCRLLNTTKCSDGHSVLFLWMQ